MAVRWERPRKRLAVLPPMAGRPHNPDMLPEGVGLVKKATKLLALVLLVACGGALAFAGAQPEGFRSVGEVASDPLAWDGREVQLKATVAEGSLDRASEPVTFLVEDGVWRLPVRWDPAHPLPDHEAGGTIEGRSVVVTGVVVVGDDGPYLLANEMQVGCASKYRAEEAA